MNKSSLIGRCLLAGIILLATSFALPANAGPHGGGHGGHGGDAGWWGLGIGLGLGWEAAHVFNPYYYPAYPVYYYPAPPVYYYQVSPPPVMVAPPPGTAASAPPAPPPAANWYYCDSARGYYPNVRQCPEGWRMIPAVPPGPIH